MEEIICYTSLLPEGEKHNITFLELLLDDRWADGEFECPCLLYSEIGDINRRLTAKQNYEFLLRAAQKYPVTAIGGTAQKDNGSPWDSYRTDCYIAGKYQQELLSSGFFNPVIETLLESASTFPTSWNALAWLEKTTAGKTA